jgi:hypothetical protein
MAWSIFGQLNTIELGFLTRLVRPVGPLACPARFERATYALEAVKMMQNNKLHNSISQAGSGVLRIEIIGVRWNSMDPTWHWPAVE